MTIDYQITIGDMIVSNFKTAPLFLGYHIDLRADRDKTIESICRDKNIDFLRLLDDLNNIAANTIDTPSDYSSWPLDLLRNMIRIRNRFVKEKLPVIQQFLERLSEIHKEQDLGIKALCTNFKACAERLINLLQRQVQVPALFIFIKQIVAAGDADFFTRSTFEPVSGGSVRTIIDEVSLHKRAVLSLVNRTNKYEPHLNAGNCYKITLELLSELQNNLYKIIGLQNILYSRLLIQGNQQIKGHH